MRIIKKINLFMATISERREATQKEIENLKNEFEHLQNAKIKIQQEGNQKIREMEDQQNKIVLLLEKLNGKIEVYNEEEPPTEDAPIEAPVT